jgi:hypothetical protein
VASGMQIGLRATSGCAGVSGDHARRHGARHGRFCHLSIEISEGCGWIVVKYRPAQLVLRSASTCLLIAMPLLWYISDETKVQFGRGSCPQSRRCRPNGRNYQRRTVMTSIRLPPRAVRLRFPLIRLQKFVHDVYG